MTRPLLIHRPYGSENPYAYTADQRIPVDPEIGQSVTIGAVALTTLTEIRCEWISHAATGQTREMLALTPAVIDATTAAAAIGGEGHLAEAQAHAAGATGDAWSATSPPTAPRTRYEYRFHATDTSGATQITDWYRFEPVDWCAEPPPGASLEAPPDKLVTGSVRWRRASGPGGSGSADRVRFALRLAVGERVVGFGERFDALDQRGRTLDTVVFEQYKSQAEYGRTYLPMPFAHVVGGTGWGFHINTSRRCWFDVAHSESDKLWIEVALGDTPHLTVTDFRGTPSQVLQAFTADVGRAQELPPWVFRLWASGNEWNTQELVMQQMDKHRDADIPVGVVVIEAWSDECTFAAFRDAQYVVNEDGHPHEASDFTFPEDGAWPNPKAMIDELHSRDIKVILWQIPLQRTEPEPTGDPIADAQARADTDAMHREGIAVREADGTAYHNRGWWFPGALMPDLTDERARRWWTDKRRYLVRDLDIDGFKTDGGEHAWGHDLQFCAGAGDEINNVFPVYYAKAFGDLLRAEGKAPVTFSRAGFTGSQRHGIIWAGDENSTWQAFRASITAGLTASACGIVYWSWDIAGFSGPVPSAELYLRATAAAAFMPIMQYHSEFNNHRRPLRDRTPWNIQQQSGDPTITDTFRSFIRIRESLGPYLTEQAHRSVSEGRPLMRALFFDYIDDAEIWHHPHQFTLGDDLLVNPVTEPGVSTWTTYLPRGQWTDIWTGQLFDGGIRHSMKTPLDRIPVFARTTAQSAALQHLLDAASLNPAPSGHRDDHLFAHHQPRLSENEPAREREEK